MQDYRQLNWYRVCEIWAGYNSEHFTSYFAGLLARNQLGVVNKKFPEGRAVTEPEARRFFQSCIHKHPLYPPDRPAKLSDLKAIRQAVLLDIHDAPML